MVELSALSSRSIGKILRIFLYAIIGLSLISFIGSSINKYQLNFYIEYVQSFDQFLSFLLFIINIIAIVLYLIWIYKVHKDLAKYELQYPITASGALRRILIPFYNIWGLWNVYSTMAKQFQKRELTFQQGKQLSTYFPFYYVLFFVSYYLNKYINSSTLEGDTNLSTLFIISSSVDVTKFLVYLVMVNSVNTALEYIANMLSASNENEIEEIA